MKDKQTQKNNHENHENHVETAASAVPRAKRGDPRPPLCGGGIVRRGPSCFAESPGDAEREAEETLPAKSIHADDVISLV